MSEMHWELLPFEKLNPVQVYALLKLRSEVFVVEQQCIFLDMDNKDSHCFHLLGWKQKELVAYTRLMPPGITYPHASIGRVVTSMLVRRTGIGRELMERSIIAARDLFNATTIVIGAQLYLNKFYNSLGFVQSSDVYFEDGIEHIEMTLVLS
ncbi:MAG: GNAT family N-acetyltransferase [Chitinophagaceae bacterium]